MGALQGDGSKDGFALAKEAEAQGAVALVVEGRARDLAFVPPAEAQTEVVTATEEPGREIVRHSAAHVLAQAVLRLQPEAKYAIGPPIAEGFYYDFEVEKPFTPEDLEAIEAEMRAIVEDNQRFERSEVSREEALETFSDQPYKLEIIAGVAEGADALEQQGAEGEIISIYRNLDPSSGEVAFTDLCRGPHLPGTGRIKAFKLTRSAGAYWRGDESKPMLQRIYGTAWESKDALAAHLHRLEEAERRDHRRLGRELELFHLDVTAPGMPYWLPKGLRVLNQLLAFWREEHESRGYQEIASPLVNDKALWVRSGHWDHYVDNMFVIPIDETTTYALKPMNCPNAMIVYNLKSRSYRDLPLRLSDADILHRYERSGTLHGLLRARRMQQDDAHIFISPDQIKDEYECIFEICDRFYGIFDLSYRLRLGTRPDSYIGDLQTWDAAEDELRAILDDRMGPERYVIEEGGGAFYGPKIDILMDDALGRSWQMGTIQLDFQLPRRFDCEYADRDGQRRTPVVVHRVIYGSLERFFGILIEHFAGAFPTWLAPVQAVFIPIADRHVECARAFEAKLRARAIRAEVDDSDDSMGAKIRRHQMQKVPYMLVVGDDEVASETVSVRQRSGREKRGVPVDDFAAVLASEIAKRALEPSL
ncbi:MAG: threonine--tRNA ligase [Actinomycetota bacterium]|nr:threonine--tRNA ligase [Actinomycetota bacterium]